MNGRLTSPAALRHRQRVKPNDETQGLNVKARKKKNLHYPALCLFINPGARFQHNTPPKRPPLAAAACSTRAATVANLVMRCPGPMNNAYFGASVTPGDD